MANIDVACTQLVIAGYLLFEAAFLCHPCLHEREKKIENYLAVLKRNRCVLVLMYVL